MVVAIATAKAVATMATQRQDGNAMATVMDGDGRCDGNAIATTAMEGVTATLQQRDGDGRRNSTTAINGSTALRRR